MDICIIGKIPPIQGGVSSSILWTAYYLAESGHKVHIVTNANEVEESSRYMTLDFRPAGHSTPFPLEHKNIKIYSSDTDKHQVYIPQANPYVSKMASIATDVVKKNNCSVIFASYFEPYAVAGSLVSRWTDIPFFVQHAGSDISRLILSEYLETTYIQVLKDCHGILSAEKLIPFFLKKDIDLSKIEYRSKPIELTYFKEHANTNFDLNSYINHIRNHPLGSIQDRYSVFPKSQINPDVPIIGLYGKAGRNKGHLELMRALGKLKAKGVNFQLVFLTQGGPKSFKNIRSEIIDQNLEENTWVLPFISPWLIPSFIKSCSLVAFLEHNFPIKIHMPSVPQQVLCSKVPLLVSTEIAQKQPFAKKMKHMDNCLIIDPSNIEKFTNTLHNFLKSSNIMQEMGPKGFQLIEQFISSKEDTCSYLSDFFESMAKNAVELKRANEQKNFIEFSSKFKNSNSNSLIEIVKKEHNSWFLKNYSEMLKSFYPLTHFLFSENFQPCLDTYLNLKHTLSPNIDELIKGFYSYATSNFLALEKQAQLLQEALTVDHLTYVYAKSSKLNMEEIKGIELKEDTSLSLSPDVHIRSFAYDLLPNLNFKCETILKKRTYLMFAAKNTFHHTGIQELSQDAFELLSKMSEKITLESLINENAHYRENKEAFTDFIQNLAQKRILKTSNTTALSMR